MTRAEQERSARAAAAEPSARAEKAEAERDEARMKLDAVASEWKEERAGRLAAESRLALTTIDSGCCAQ